jgi:hypothetical protein
MEVVFLFHCFEVVFNLIFFEVVFHFFLGRLSSWVKIMLHSKNQLPRLRGVGWVGGWVGLVGGQESNNVVTPTLVELS